MLQRQCHRWRDDLHRLVVNRLKAGAQRLVAAHDFLQALFQHFGVQLAVEPHDVGHVVQRIVRFQLIQEPEPLLGKRQRQRLVALTRGTSAALCSPCCWRCKLSTRSASPATVGASNKARSGSSTWNACRIRETTCVAKQRVSAQLRRSRRATPT